MIKTKEEYKTKVKRFEEVFFAKVGTKESDEAEILGNEIEEYENKYYPIPRPSREDVDSFRKDQKGGNES